MDKKLLAAVVLLLAVGGGALYFIFDRDEPAVPELVQSGVPVAPTEVTAPKVRRPGASEAVMSSRPTAKSPTAAPAAVTSKDPFGTPLGGVTGIVTDSEGGPIPGAVVVLYEDAAPNAVFGLTLPGKKRGETATDASGAFSFDDLATYESFLLVASAKDFVSASVAPLSLVAGRRIETALVLSRGVAVTGSVSDAAGRPLQGVVVTERNAREASMDTLHSALSTATTGPDGKFSIAHVAPGVKTFDAVLAGYARGIVADLEVRTNDAPRPVDFVLQKGFSIKGTVVGDAQGGRSGISGAEVGLAAVEVAANPILFDGAGVKLRTVTVTDASGNFVLDGLAEGSFVVTASIPGTSFMTNANANAGAEGLLLTLKTGTRVRGVVQDDETGAPVRAFSLISSPTPQLMARPRERTQNVVSADGAFDLPLSYITPTMRSVYLFALAPGFAGGSVEVVLMPPSGPPTAQAKLVDGLVIRMRRGAKITGKVVDSAGAAVAGARITLVEAPDEGADPVMHRLAAMLTRSNGPSAAGAPGARGFSGADGRFEFAGPLPGRYYVRVEHDEFASQQAKEAFSAPPNGSFDTGVFRLVLGGRVRGTVRNRQKEPEEGSRVVLAPTEFLGGEHRQVMTGVMGEYDFDHVPPGVYTLGVSERRGVATALSNIFRGQAANAEQLTITVVEGETIVKDL